MTSVGVFREVPRFAGILFYPMFRGSPNGLIRSACPQAGSTVHDLGYIGKLGKWSFLYRQRATLSVSISVVYSVAPRFALHRHNRRLIATIVGLDLGRCVWTSQYRK